MLQPYIYRAEAEEEKIPKEEPAADMSVWGYSLVGQLLPEGKMSRKCD